MKKSTKLLTDAGITAGAALGVLFAPAKGSETRKKLDKKIKKIKGSFNGDCDKEELLMIKEKLEKHKERLEKHLQHINSKLASFDVQDLEDES